MSRPTPFNPITDDLDCDLDLLINRSANPIHPLNNTVSRRESATRHNEVELYSPTTAVMNRPVENHRLVNGLRVPRPISSQRNELRRGRAFTIFEDNNNITIQIQPLGNHLRLDTLNGGICLVKGFIFRQYVEKNDIYKLRKGLRQFEAQRPIEMAIQALCYPFDEQHLWILEHIRDLLYWRWSTLREIRHRLPLSEDIGEKPVIPMPENKFEAAKLARTAINSFDLQYIAACRTAFHLASRHEYDFGKENRAP